MSYIIIGYSKYSVCVYIKNISIIVLKMNIKHLFAKVDLEECLVLCK